MRVIIFLVMSLVASMSHAGNQDALELLNKIMASEELTQKAYAAGEERISLCGYCHGRDGNSTRSNIPNLAEQSAVYLFSAFEKYASGERSDFVMTQAANMLSIEERVNIALYYGMQKVKEKKSVNPELDSLGEQRFNTICIACHGPNGMGMDDAPRLAGQPAPYVRHALQGFRDDSDYRPGSLMLPIAAQLSNQDIEALASYIQGLNP